MCKHGTGCKRWAAEERVGQPDIVKKKRKRGKKKKKEVGDQTFSHIRAITDGGWVVADSGRRVADGGWTATGGGCLGCSARALVSPKTEKKNRQGDKGAPWPLMPPPPPPHPPTPAYHTNVPVVQRDCGGQDFLGGEHKASGLCEMIL